MKGTYTHNKKRNTLKKRNEITNCISFEYLFFLVSMLLGNVYVYIILKSSSVVQDQIIQNIFCTTSKNTKSNVVDNIYIV